MFAYEKLPGLPRERVLDAIEPVLRAHGLAGVELVWRTDGQGRLLYVTVESADAAEPGQGVTLEVCSRLSRDLSTAFDVHNLFDGQYRLEVGSPGLERKLYTTGDYQRFRGKLAKLKLAAPVAGQSVITGTLAGVDDAGNVLLENDDAPRAVHTESAPAKSFPAESAAATSGAAASEGAAAKGAAARAVRAIPFDQIRSGQLVVDWQQMGFSPTPRQRAGRRSVSQGRK